MSQARKQLVISVGLGALLLLAAMLALMVSQPVMAAGEDGTRDSITPTSLSHSGVAQSLSAASGDGHKFANTGEEIVVVTNDYTETVTMTVQTGGTVGGLAIADVDVALTAGQTKIVGPFNKTVFNQPGGSDYNQVYLDFNAAVTATVANSVTLAVYRVR